MDNTSKLSVVEEFSKVAFGDKRLTNRLVNLAKKLEGSPEASLPRVTETESELEGAYRLLRNDRVSPEQILAPHFEATIARAKSADRLLAIHDSTVFKFGGESRQEEIGRVNQKDQGFLGHFALLTSRTEFSHPLGIIGYEPTFRHGGNRREVPKGKKDPQSESLRWGRLVTEVENRLESNVRPIHIMDSEADDYYLLSQMVSDQQSFIVRSRQDRNQCRILGKAKRNKLSALCEEFEFFTRREVFLSKRKSKGPSKRIKSKRGCPRNARKAQLKITAEAIEIPKPKYVPLEGSKLEKLFVNLVHVYEVKPPKGEIPVDWKLITTEQINTEEEVLNIVDDYRARWLIEEYYKALKTGCNYEKAQLETKKTLLTMLAIQIPIAWQLLVLRSLSRQSPSAPAELIFTKKQIEVLRVFARIRKPLSPRPKAKEIAYAIAGLGGHITNNGPPGWMVLSRGLQQFINNFAVWNTALEHAKQGCDQS